MNIIYTKKDLISEVERLNEKYCGKTKNILRIAGAYGGYQVQLTGKERKDGKGYLGIGSGNVNITNGFLKPQDVLCDLWRADSKGFVEETIKNYEKRR